MKLEALVAEYGYAIVLLGTMFEGESIMMLGGFFAARSYLELPWVLLCGFIGTCLSEYLFYYLGRTRGAGFIEQRPRWKQRSKVVFELLHRHKYVLIIGHRFIYGMRSITPFAVGASGIRPLTFTLLNAAGAAIWTAVIGTAGYYFGRKLQELSERMESYDHWVLPGIFCIIFLVWLISYSAGRYVTEER